MNAEFRKMASVVTVGVTPANTRLPVMAPVTTLPMGPATSTTLSASVPVTFTTLSPAYLPRLARLPVARSVLLIISPFTTTDPTFDAETIVAPLPIPPVTTIALIPGIRPPTSASGAAIVVTEPPVIAPLTTNVPIFPAVRALPAQPPVMASVDNVPLTVADQSLPVAAALIDRALPAMLHVPPDSAPLANADDNDIPPPVS